jgi:hypothetical protein
VNILVGDDRISITGCVEEIIAAIISLMWIHGIIHGWIVNFGEGSKKSYTQSPGKELSEPEQGPRRVVMGKGILTIHIEKFKHLVNPACNDDY